MKLVVFLELVLICWNTRNLRIWLVSFQVSDKLVGCTKVDLYEILLKVCFRNKLKNNQLRLIGACSIISCLSTGLTARFCFVSPGYAIQLFYPCVISCFSEQINLLTTCFKAEFQVYISHPGFSVRTPEQFDTIYWTFNLFTWFFCFFLVDYLGRWNQWM